MLVLNRTSGEAYVIRCPTGELITVRIEKLDRGRVVHSFDAPQNVEIWREEIWQEKKVAK